MPIQIQDDERQLDTATGIARRLGVRSQQIITWWSRRDRNGFPDTVGKNDGTIIPVMVKHGPAGKLFDVEAVLDWYVAYKTLPVNSIGRPIGDRTRSRISA